MARKRKPVVEPLSAQQDQDAQTEEAQAAASKAMAIIERLEVEGAILSPPCQIYDV